MKQVHSTLQSVIQNRTVNLETIKQEDEQILKKISEFKTSIIEKINELEKSTFSELQRVRQMSILQIETDKATAEKSVKLVEEYLQQIDFPSEISSQNDDVFASLDAISRGTTLSQDLCISDMQWRQQGASCCVQKKSRTNSGCTEQFLWIGSILKLIEHKLYDS
jgi:hypothetical protein